MKQHLNFRQNWHSLMKLGIVLLGVLSFTLEAQSQVTIGANQAPDPSAVLDLQSNDNLGLLLPRVVLTDTLVAAPLAAHVKGMFVYNTTPSADGKVVEGIYYNDGRRWWQTNSGLSSTEPWQIAGTTDQATSNTDNIYQMGQVGIGTTTPDPSAVLEVVSPGSANPQGILVPRMSGADRDKIASPADGLLIFNTDEKCFNYYSGPDAAWNSMCGGVGKASFGTITCSNDVTVNGIYVQGAAANGSNYLSVNVTVNKAGNYSISGTTTNGYGFSTSGVALNPGPLTINVPAQGTPLNQGTDQVAMTVNGVEYDCDVPPTVTVGPPTATFTINCGAVSVNPLAQFATTQPAQNNPNNTVTVSITVTKADASTSNVSITTDNVNGVSFSGNGICPVPGSYKITLYPTGTLTSADPATFTLTAATSGDQTATCTFTITPVAPALVGGVASWGTGNYHLTAPGSNVNTNQTGNMMANPANFGPNGIVKYAGQGVTVTDYGLTDNITAILTAATKPDMVFINYAKNFSAADATALANYMKIGGIVILCQPENNAANVSTMLQNLYGAGIGVTGTGGTTSQTFALPTMTNDPVINGPFMNLSGLSVAEDGAGDQLVTSRPATVVDYITGANNTGYFFRDNGTALNGAPYNFIYIADGGFWHPTDTQGAAFTGNDYPLYTKGGVNAVPSYRQNGSGKTIYNAYLLCNIMSWALNQAVTNGVNAAQYQQ